MLAGIKASVRKTLRSLGYEFGRYRPEAPSVNRRLLFLQANSISLVLDVGANGGQYGHAIRRIGYTGKIISFEPLSEVHSKLKQRADQDPQWQTRNHALGEADATIEINIAANTMSSSFLPMKERHMIAFPDAGYVGTETVKMARLDSLAKEIVAPTDRLWLKMDVQGYEINVLKGAQETLDQVQVIEMEICLTPLYDGQPTPGQMLTYLHDLGFDPVMLEDGDVEEASRYTLYVDAIFVRRGVQN